jgi:hypothetical protein
MPELVVELLEVVDVEEAHAQRQAGVLGLAQVGVDRTQIVDFADQADVMEVAGERTRLLPWVPTVVKQVDLEAKRIEVEWEADW